MSGKGRLQEYVIRQMIFFDIWKQCLISFFWF
jgi:hypothetical protein